MPEAQEQFQNGVAKVLEAVIKQNWLRFYFITEKPDAPAAADGQPALFIAVPVKALERISELFPRMLPLAEGMNGQEVNFETRAARSVALCCPTWTVMSCPATQRQ